MNKHQFHNTRTPSTTLPELFLSETKKKSLSWRSRPDQYKKDGSEDRSLRVLTLSVADVKRWCHADSQLVVPLLFEVFGIVDSTAQKESGCCKFFVLRDESGSIGCLFYEIDRQLPNLIRGQWHRCVGMLHSKREALQCLSVRQAGSEERNAAHRRSVLSTRQCRLLCGSLNEQ